MIIINDTGEEKGNHNVVFSVKNLREGIYYCSINTGRHIITKKIIVL